MCRDSINLLIYGLLYPFSCNTNLVVVLTFTLRLLVVLTFSPVLHLLNIKSFLNRIIFLISFSLFIKSYSRSYTGMCCESISFSVLLYLSLVTLLPRKGYRICYVSTALRWSTLINKLIFSIFSMNFCSCGSGRN